MLPTYRALMVMGGSLIACEQFSPCHYRPTLTCKKSPISSLLQTGVNDHEEDVYELSCINRCRKILLDANADPLLDLDHDMSPYILNVVTFGVLVCTLFRISSTCMSLT